MEKYELGRDKKSFSLFYNGGSIWAEHLDSLCDKRELFIEKWKSDFIEIKRPSTSGFIAINMDETEVDESMMELVLTDLKECPKPLRRVAFVGLNRACKKQVKDTESTVSYAMKCFSDYEKSKEWLIHK